MYHTGISIDLDGYPCWTRFPEPDAMPENWDQPPDTGWPDAPKQRRFKTMVGHGLPQSGCGGFLREKEPQSPCMRA